jgi:hypothetical protein
MLKSANQERFGVVVVVTTSPQRGNPKMFEYMLMPLHRHLDGGFGATGEAFMEAADQLLEAKKEGTLAFISGHLPINFLYRHAIELFLKSMIVVIFKRQLGDDDWFQDERPKVVSDGKWKELHHVHGILELYAFYRALVHAYAEELREIAKTDWSVIPDELTSWIRTIDKADPVSTFFRYPTTKNADGDVEKSTFKEIDPAAAMAAMRESPNPAKAYLFLKDETEQVVAAFGQDHEPIPELREALVSAARLLFGMHIGIRAELANGQ